MKPRFARRWSWLALLPLTLAACTVGPDYKLPDEALINAPLAHAPLDPVGAPVSTAAALSGDWWRLYDDPVLNELIEAALRSNTDLRIAAANLARSRAALAVAEAQGGFEGGASAQFLRAQDSAEQHLLASKLEPDNMGDVGLSISYEIDLFGKLRRVVEAARADDEAVEAAQDLARIAVVSDVVRAYVGSCSAGEELAIAKESFKLQQERVALVRQLRDAGRGNQTEVTRGETQVRMAAADIPQFESKQRIAQYQLAMLLARAPGDLPQGVATCARLPQLSQPIPVGDGAALLRRRPDVRQAERMLAVSTAEIGVAVADLYPSISIGLSSGSTGLARDLFETLTNRWAFGPLISWNFPLSGQRARVKEAEAATRGALARFDGVVLNALRETQTSLSAYAADVQRAERLRAAYESARQSADETHRLYLAGRESFLADLDATRTLTQVHAQLAAAEGQVAQDQVRLFQALGGGWEKPDEVAKADAKAQPTGAPEKEK